MGIFTLVKRNDREGVYYVDGTFSGTRVRRSLDTRDRIVAKQRLLEFEDGVISGRIKLHQPIGTRKTLFNTVAKKFLTSPRTGSSRTTKQIALKLCDYFGAMQVKFITEGDVDDYIEEFHLQKGNSNSTIRRELNTLQSILNFAASRGEREYIKVDKPPEDNPKHETLTDVEMDTIFSHLQNDVHRISTFLRYTGCRPVEALALTYDDVDYDNSKVILRSIKGRTGSVRERVIPLHPKAKEAIPYSVPPPIGHVFTVNGRVIKNSYDLPSHWKAARAKAYPNMTTGMYALRHTFATTLARNGAPAKVIADLLGHTDLKMVMRYMNTTYDDHLKAIQMMA
jgi:integrase